MKAILGFRSITWIAGFVVGFSQSSFESFMAIANNFLSVRYSISEEIAGYMLSVFYLVAAVLTPIFGEIVDKFGNKANFVLGSACCLVLGFGLFLTIPRCEGCYIGLIPLTVMGLYSGMF